MQSVLDRLQKKEKTEIIMNAGTWLLLGLGIFLRLYALGRIPYGLNQDEASIGYEAYTLAVFGTDRYGNPWPVYPITWGSGGGSPLMVYLAVVTTKLFGVGVWSLRLTPAILGCLTLIVFNRFVKECMGPRVSLLSALLICFNPWHMMMSRWELDCNTLPFWLICAAFFFVRAMRPERSREQSDCSMGYAILSAAFFALCIYAYGSATIVVPVSLILLASTAIKRGDLTKDRVVAAVVTFVVVILPIGIFFFVNYLGLPDMMIGGFSFVKFTNAKSTFYAFNNTLPRNMWQSMLYLLRFLTIGSQDNELICSQIPGYGTMYRFTFPLFWVGLGTAIGGSKFYRENNTRKEKLIVSDRIMLTLFFCSALFSLFIELNISHMTMFLIPMLYFQVRGFMWLVMQYKPVAIGFATAVLLGGLFFCRDYFGARYRELSAESFMPGYGEAILYADALAGDNRIVYSTYRHVAAPYMVALYYLQTPVDTFRDTVHWKEDNTEFRIADSFDKFVFGLPEDIQTDPYGDDILILHKEEAGAYDDVAYDKTVFGDFVVTLSR